jgi:hypothetical protein
MGKVIPLAIVYLLNSVMSDAVVGRKSFIPIPFEKVEKFR